MEEHGLILRSLMVSCMASNSKAITTACAALLNKCKPMVVFATARPLSLENGMLRTQWILYLIGGGFESYVPGVGNLFFEILSCRRQIPR